MSEEIISSSDLLKQLSLLAEHFDKHPNIYLSAPVAVEPERYLEAWQIEKVWSEEAGITFHFFGRDCRYYDGRVSSAIKSFDAKTMQGVTRSGRVYQLVGLPGHSADAEYVLRHWLSLYTSAQSYEIGTAEFIALHGIDLEKVALLEGRV